MKKSLILLSLSGFISSLFLFSCATTLQEDVFLSSDISDKVLEASYDYESQFIKFDALFYEGEKPDEQQLIDFQKDVLQELKQKHLEPAVYARLNSFLGLTSIFRKDYKSAQNYFLEAKNYQSSDDYSIILKNRLEKSWDTQLENINSILEKDSKNGILVLEQAKILYSQGSYDKAVASFDSAFLIFDLEEKLDYRECYKSLREKAWTLFSAGIKNQSADVNLTAESISKEDMLNLTIDNTSLLQDFTGGMKISTKDLLSKLESAGFLSAAIDQDNVLQSSKDILNADKITKLMAARFIWNLYINKKGKKNQINRYSKRYNTASDSVSPINDVSLENIDFDAAMGVVEAGIMIMPDGMNFYPEDFVKTIDFITYIKKADK